MDYELLEDEIVAILQPFAAVGVTVEKVPETESQRNQTLPGKARLTVIYAGSEYEGTRSTAQVSQNEKVFIQVLVESTFLRGPLGVYNLTNIVKRALTDTRPRNITKLQVTKHHTIGTPEAEKKNNMWQYQIIFQGTNLHVELHDQGESWESLLKKITYLDGAETVVVPPPAS